ncbi:MAG: DUF2490 domain-containing protein [Chlamydiales bacterium]|nr:DUF2490 domain-containing protein [Chlamydiia bacterium]MCP5508476.1 DUF2490 domain-containing protein [Chlamydiales bacterium]
MKNTLLSILLFCFVLPCTLIGEKPGSEIWLRTRKELRGDAEWAIKLAAEQRWNENASQFYYEYMQFGLEKKLACGWSVAPYYRHVSRRGPDGHWVQEPEAFLDLRLDFPIVDGFDNSRFTWNSVRKVWEYRNRLQLFFPTGIPFVKYYLSEELFFRKMEEISQSRFRVGICASSLPMEPCTGYILRSRKTERGWKNDHVWEVMVNAPF